MYKIRTYNQISVKGLERLPRERYEVASEITHPDGILLRSHKLSEGDITADVKGIARAGNLKRVQEIIGRREVNAALLDSPGACFVA